MLAVRCRPPAVLQGAKGTGKCHALQRDTASPGSQLLTLAWRKRSGASQHRARVGAAQGGAEHRSLSQCRLQSRPRLSASSKGKSRESKIERNYAGNWCNGSQLPAVLGYIMIAELRNALQVFLAEAVSGGRSSECRTAVRCCSPIPCAQWAHIHPAAYSPGNSPACSSPGAMLPPLSLCSHPSESSPAWALPAPSLPSYPVLRVQSLQRAADIRTLTALSPLPGPGSAPCPPARALGCIRAPRIALCQKEGWI